MIVATVGLERDEDDAVKRPTDVVRVPAQIPEDVAPGTVN
jgi:hypothetical protein